MTDNPDDETPESEDVPEVEGSRGLLTTRDREKLAGVDVTDERRYQTASGVRERIENLKVDVAWLERHHPKLLEELRESVCDQDPF